MRQLLLVSVLVLVGLCSGVSLARAETELKNDGFVTNGTAGFQGGFTSGEAGASRFVAPVAGRQLLKVQLLFGGGSTAEKTVTLKVFDDTAGTDAPGAELHNQDYVLTGSDTQMQEIDLSGQNLIVPAQFRVAVVFQHDGAPSIARDADGSIAADKNYILAAGLGWKKSSVLGLTGDWVIRAFITDGGVTPDGANTSPDAGVGGPCAGNSACPTGQFCDLSNHACTFECRTADDCGGGTCNSLGMCVAATDGGGCCEADGNGTGAGALLGLGTFALLLVVRRRSPCA